MDVQTFLTVNKGRPQGTELPDPGATLHRLLAKHLGVTTASLSAYPERTLAPEITDPLERDLLDLERGRPEAYVLGNIPFLDWDFRCDDRALIPRVETEALAAMVIACYAAQEPPRRILDLCCGSGVLGIALALYFPDAFAVLTDLGESALTLCAENTADHGLTTRTQILQGDLWDPVPPIRFDLIVGNPPYVAREDEVGASVRDWEPDLALYSEDQGTAHIKAILSRIGDFLAPDGLAAFELGHNHEDALSPWLLHLDLPGRFLWQKDPFGVRRFLFYDPTGVATIPPIPASRNPS